MSCTNQVHFGRSKDVQHKSGTASVRARMCSTCNRSSSFGTLLKILSNTFHKSLILFIYEVKRASSLWQAGKSINYEMLSKIFSF